MEAAMSSRSVLLVSFVLALAGCNGQVRSKGSTGGVAPPSSAVNPAPPSPAPAPPPPAPAPASPTIVYGSRDSALDVLALDAATGLLSLVQTVPFVAVNTSSQPGWSFAAVPGHLA